MNKKKIIQKLHELACNIVLALPAGWGFTLLVFDFGETGTMLYVSNAQRADVIKAMEEFISKQKGEGNG